MSSTTSWSTSTFILVLANRRSLMGANANTLGFRVLATVCTVGVGILAAFVAIQTAFGLG